MSIGVEDIGISRLAVVLRKAVNEMTVVGGAGSHQVDLRSIRSLQRELDGLMERTVNDQVHMVCFALHKTIDDLFDDFFGDIPYSADTERARVLLARELASILRNIAGFDSKTSGENDGAWIIGTCSELRKLRKLINNVTAASNQQYQRWRAGA